MVAMRRAVAMIAVLGFFHCPPSGARRIHPKADLFLGHPGSIPLMGAKKN